MRAQKTLICLLLALSVAVAAGCKQKAGEETKESSTTTASSGPVLAEVNGKKITEGDFRKEIENLPPYLKPMTETPEGKKEMVDTMVVRELILQQADKEGLDKDPQVQQKLDEMKKRLVVEAYLKKKVEQGAAPTDAEMKAFYDKNKDKFNTGEQIHASHILVKTEDEAKAILKDLKAGGNFEELAKKHSIDAAGPKGGDLGWFGKGTMLPEFENAAFALKQGETSGLVHTKFGYHIIKVTGKRPAGQRSYEEVKDQIKQALVPQKQQEVFKKLKEDLRKNGKVTVHDDAISKVTGAPATGGEKAAPAPAPAPAPAAK